MQISTNEVLKYQRVHGVDEEYGNLDVVVAVLKTPELEGFLQLGDIEYVFNASNPNASRAYIIFESHFGGW